MPYPTAIPATVRKNAKPAIEKISPAIYISVLVIRAICIRPSAYRLFSRFQYLITEPGLRTCLFNIKIQSPHDVYNHRPSVREADHPERFYGWGLVEW